ncbi:glutamine--fructose-6-phosphate transaminase (isomerizing) [Natronorarus salvus]|uniref:glutamine--fructose-6-phosphate transaminase (isomerizing) n=1 Tax=Natronorarus salvus TaxID=3117733 RepID=UPI002F266F21
MCGIVGYIDGADGPAVLEVLRSGLSGLDYRGYDSAGVALVDDELTVVKREGELDALEEALDSMSRSGEAWAGIGHTRWSTHGKSSDANAHPHTDCTGEIAVVHNGIIENYRALRSELTEAGHTFESETDTEVVPHLIEDALCGGVDPEIAFQKAVSRLEGNYAIAVLFEGADTVLATRWGSPLVVGCRDTGGFIASDVTAFVEFTARVIYLEDGQFVRLSPAGVEVTSDDGRVLSPQVHTVSWDPEDAEKGEYDHYMLKEIMEQPRALRECLGGRIDGRDRSVDLEGLEDLDANGPVQFVACGTSYHAALIGARLFRTRGVHAQAFLASEYTTESIPIDSETLVVGVTQSGETADTLRALREADRAGATTLAVTNVVASSAARECDHVLYVRAGPEISVAATKTFASQQVALAMLACALTGEGDEVLSDLLALPDQLESVLDTSNAEQVARRYDESDAYFFIGRGYNHPVALEGALKMKEISYEHAEGFAAGELKHGPLALVTDETPVFAVVTGDDESARKTIGNVREVASRGAPVVVVTDGESDAAEYGEDVLWIPPTGELVGSVLANVQLQLVSYWVATELGRSIDKPRNLAKSVTVE